MSPVWSVVLPLAQKTPNPADVKPGWLGFAMFVALAVATVLLWLSFRRQLKKVRFEEEPLPPRRTPGGEILPPTRPTSSTGTEAPRTAPAEGDG